MPEDSSHYSGSLRRDRLKRHDFKPIDNNHKLTDKELLMNFESDYRHQIVRSNRHPSNIGQSCMVGLIVKNKDEASVKHINSDPYDKCKCENNNNQ